MYFILAGATGAKGGWRLAWQTMMKELAPQTKDGAYARPSYQFNTGSMPAPLKACLVDKWAV